jgi:hypothetical protein
MDATVQAALTSGVTTFKSDAFTVLAAIFPIAILVTITLALTRKGVKWFRGLARI